MNSRGSYIGVIVHKNQLNFIELIVYLVYNSDRCFIKCLGAVKINSLQILREARCFHLVMDLSGKVERSELYEYNRCVV